MSIPSILTLENLCKTFVSGERQLTVVDNISLEIGHDSSCAIVGPSGSGKTTLLGLCAGLDTPTSGRVTLDGVDLGELDEDGRALLRNNRVGFVFQNFQLIPTLTALENVMVPAELQGVRSAGSRAAELLDRVGLGERLNHYPVQLSGGEQQRVSIARAFINEPKILFADEPTGNLDAETSEKITSLLFDIHAESGSTLVLVTHDLQLAAMSGRIIKLKGGRIESDQPTGGLRATS